MKPKQISALMSIKVPGLGNSADMDSIEKKINTYIESISPGISIEDLSGWRVTFDINSFCTDLIAIYKKFWGYPSDREYVISIAIPLPDNTQAPYGMPPGENGRSGSFPPVESDHFYPLAPEYDKYASLEQYIIVSAIKAIDFGLTKGFTCDGKEIKFQDL
ncbi:hypothetical protein AXK12_04210 [Cephaloticoccus capnophilus]|uniref:Uncharacterized protein n=1 Tax=Cephaloticoccus capnophilus TaxID=1548208 RepID=A0A139SNH8_9BACT|nr:Imm9 family immunity protein [Cephaloticoccus capnophilus]KXU36034.1 hypothetical protein AXK12_04210 [Cephaloticoccus capnophilus]